MTTEASAVVVGPSPAPGRAFLAPLLLTLALFGPSSTNGAIAPSIVLAWSGVAILLFVSPVVLGRAPFRPGGLWFGAAGLSVLALATVVSPFNQLAPGAVLPYAAAFAMMAFRAGDLPLGRGTARWLSLANVVLLVVGGFIVAGDERVRAWVVQWYAVVYEDLVPNMTGWRKPVFSFGSHSTAAFAYYLLFLLQWEDFRRNASRWALVLALLNAAMSLALTSAAAVGFAGLTVVRLAAAGRRQLWVWAVASLVVAAAVVAASDLLGPFSLEEALRLAFGADDGGFRGRYLSGGTIAGSLSYIAQYPLRPVGLSYSTEVFYGDSGPVEQLLRGSVPLVVLVYGALVCWIRTEVRDAGHRRQLLVAVLLFELGFSALTFFRFALLLPFVVAYLNYVSARRAPAHA